MIISAGPVYLPPSPSPKRAEEPKDKTDDTERNDRIAKSTAAQFAALMEMLATNAKLRTELLKQVSADNASTLDKMLAANAGDTSAADSVRYGMLMIDTPRGSTRGNGELVPLPGGLATPSASGSQSRISPEVLARIAGRKSSSVQELLAVGDRAGAVARAKLDALLATAGSPDAQAALAAAQALAAALAISASNASTPVSSTDGLDPEFRARLERVMQRMNDEFGSEVSVVESVRSQQRQDNLFAQGRSAPGNVVTWTQNSAHTRGQAADVIVDGRWENAEGFARLQQIAKEEGLRTLGEIDPGHLELPANAISSSQTRTQNPAASSAQSGIARVATVAAVAEVASIGNMEVRSMSSARAMPAAPPGNASLGIMAEARQTSGDSHSASQDSGRENTARRDKGADALRTTLDENAAFGELSKSGAQKFIGPVESAERPSGTSAADAVQRVQDIHALREQAPASPVSQIKLEVDGVNGETQHITIDMRGSTVGTNISTDAASADRMRARIGDLQSSLEGHGLHVDSVRISSSSRPADTAEGVKQISTAERDVMRLGGAAPSSAGEDNLQQGHRERSNATRDWEERQAAREEQKRSNKQQQDRQRPQYQEKQ